MVGGGMRSTKNSCEVLGNAGCHANAIAPRRPTFSYIIASYLRKQLLKFSLNNVNAGQAHLFSRRESRLCKALCVALAKRKRHGLAGAGVGLLLA